ncbi:MAG: 30S ribosomal protein S2 [Planctomycetota bacterium]|nr:MAG: 30S ribosomal protein S2 [Planctomycetota bacterium]
MSDLSVKALVDAGAHIGCRVSRWNPKMEPYIFEARNRIHIIDLRQTVRGILRARHFLRELVASGQDVLLVGTKPQIRPEIQKFHEETKQPYVDDRWIGGTLTNYEVIGSRIAFLDDMEKKEAEGYLDTLSGKAASRFMRNKRKVWRNLHGIRDMFRLPGALIIVDPKTESNAAREAAKMGIPVVGVIDTDGDPDTCDMVIPANDDAIRSVALVLSQLSEAVQEGLRLRKERKIPEPGKEAAVEPPAPKPRPRGGRKGGTPRGPRGIVAPSGVVGKVEITPVKDKVKAAVEAAKAAQAAKAEAEAKAEAKPADAGKEGDQPADSDNKKDA